MGRNHTEIDGRILRNDGLRYTPAGVPSTQLRLVHDSEQIESGRMRQIVCELDVVSFGDQARALAGLAEGARVTLAGFLERRGIRDSHAILHVTEFELIKE